MAESIYIEFILEKWVKKGWGFFFTNMYISFRKLYQVYRIFPMLG